MRADASCCLGSWMPTRIRCSRRRTRMSSTSGSTGRRTRRWPGGPGRAGPRGKLAEYCDVFWEAVVFPAEKARVILDAARALGFGIRMHAGQFTAEGAQLAAEVGADTADHLEAVDDGGLEGLRSAGVQP